MTTETKETEKHIDYLDEDPTISGQEWICVSFLSPEGIKKCDSKFKGGFKFRGAFRTQEEAETHAKEIQDKLDHDFHVFVGEGFKWLPFAPDPESIEKQEYAEEELNKLMKSTKENLIMKKQHEAERKKQMLQESMEKGGKLAYSDHSASSMRERLQRKHMKQKESEKDEEKKEKLEKLIPTKEQVDAKMAEIEEDEKAINGEKKEAKDLGVSLKKMQNMYKTILEKSKKK